jgi:hypothetical protein
MTLEKQQSFKKMVIYPLKILSVLSENLFFLYITLTC